jgi:predicted Na+-dependent transporter
MPAWPVLEPGPRRHDPGILMPTVFTLLPPDTIGLLAFACVFTAMVALGAGVSPRDWTLRPGDVRRIAQTGAVALVLVPAVALVAARIFALEGPALVGLLLVGISPGAPLALRRSRDAGGNASFATILQIVIAIASVVAVPVWILLLDAIFSTRHDIALGVLARQVFLAQILPLACGAAFALLAPALAARVAPLMLRLSGLLLLVIALAVLAYVFKALTALPLAALLASLCVTAVALAGGDRACGPGPDTRTAGAIVCALRNPGVAFLVASANGLPNGVRIMVLAHVLLTTLLVIAYVTMRRRLSATG